MKRLSLLLIGTGLMAGQHAKRFAAIDEVEITAAVDINEQRVHAFCQEHQIQHAYTELSEALNNHSFDAVSVVTPDVWHAEPSIVCLEAGLHVLCEKPLSDSLQSCQAMVAAANNAGTVNMVNLTYRVSGALHTARQWVDAGELGNIRHIEASYRQSWLTSHYLGDWKTEEAWLWRLSTAHGSAGVLGDIGIHLIDFITAGVGQDIKGLQCRLKTFDKAPGNQIGEYCLDANDSCVLTFELEQGALGVAHMSRFQTGHRNDLYLTIHGTRGALRVGTGYEGDKLEACIGTQIDIPEWQNIPCEQQPDTFERFIRACCENKQTTPDFSHAAKLQAVLEACADSHQKGAWLSMQH